METEGPGREAELDEILEYCNTLRQSPVPADDALPKLHAGAQVGFIQKPYRPAELVAGAGPMRGVRRDAAVCDAR